LYLDACSHIFDKSSAGNILRIIQDSRNYLVRISR
jgi:hypothetical protein